MTLFQSTPSAWRETFPALSTGTATKHFNPLPPHGGRHAVEVAPPEPKTFQSTPSAWRETVSDSHLCILCLISIHSLRMEGDPPIFVDSATGSTFQSTPSAWRETCHIAFWLNSSTFQSTPSAWRETFVLLFRDIRNVHFNPLPPHGGRRLRDRPIRQTDVISIHSLRMEGDGSSTVARQVHSISIHSLRMEGDWSGSVCRSRRRYFNPLPPHGGRPSGCIMFTVSDTFQSTPSAWRETPVDSAVLPESGTFQSTPSAWRETRYNLTSAMQYAISIHSLRMEGDKGTI